MTKSLSDLSIGHAYAPTANTGSNLTFYQKLEQQIDWMLALNLDWQAIGTFAALIMAIFTALLLLLLANSMGNRIVAARKALPIVT